jgi:hypothetical protein
MALTLLIIIVPKIDIANNRSTVQTAAKDAAFCDPLLVLLLFAIFDAATHATINPANANAYSNLK